MTRRLVAMNDALVDHAVDDRGGMGESRVGFFLVSGLQRRGGLSNGGPQMRGQRVIAGAVNRRLSGSFFSRFRIRQAEDS